MKAILAAIDFSSASEQVVAEAAALARALGGQVILVTALIEPVYLQEYAPSPPNIAKVTVDQEKAVRKKLVTMRQHLESRSVPAEIVVRRGNAAENILAEARERDTAYIVIGSHGHSAFYELILGSTTQRVLKQAREPVVVIPAKMRKRPQSKAAAVTRARKR